MGFSPFFFPPLLAATASEADTNCCRDQIQKQVKTLLLFSVFIPVEIQLYCFPSQERTFAFCSKNHQGKTTAALIFTLLCENGSDGNDPGSGKFISTA
jgi:hypothetical protein